MSRIVTLMPGDGIGPEIVESVKEIFSAAGVPIGWEEEDAGQVALDKKGELIPKSLLESLERNKIGLKGPISTPVGKGFKSVNIQLRQYFDLHANIRPCKSIPGLKTRFDNVDLVTFRENTEGLYAGLEIFDERLGIADSIGRITVNGCERLIRSAFEYAQKHKRKRVTLVHKANILKIAGATFLDAGKKVAKDFPEVELDDIIIDNMCMQLVSRPENFDVIATTNLFGDILSDLCAGLVGGLGITPGANMGKDVAIFEAVHGSAPDIAGKGIANPTALLKSGIMMLEHLELTEHASKISKAVDMALANEETRTGDLKGKANTKQFTSNVIENLSKV
ncbi:isocitrate/isopropylmalate family dehydrogenase [Cytophagaceae bacterium ABcell3]|nr:isocitrate/isopropylmalate family dehydrogenase [Cytophagaceae bacterium ABcell3]